MLPAMLPLAAWLHDLDPFALRISQGFGIRWYGLSYLAGFVVGFLLLRLLAKRRLILLTPEQTLDAIVAIAVGVLVGGRLGYLLIYDRSLLFDFSSAPPFWGALAITRGGMASHGGVLGVILACWLIARRARAPVLHVTDCFALVAPIGLFFGRLANFVNGELLGRIVSAPGEPAPWWSVKYPQELLEGHAPPLSAEQEHALTTLLVEASAPGADYREAAASVIRAVQRGDPGVAERLAPLIASRHPSQLYQALAEGVILGLVLLLAWRKPRRPGVVSALFLMVYGVGRIITEFWRLPDAHLAVQRPGGLSYGQWLSAVMIAAGVAILLAVMRNKNAPLIGGWGVRRTAAGG